MSHVDDDG
jgi:ankyrin repeat protein